MQWMLEDVHNWEELRDLVDTALLPLYLYRSDVTLPQHVKRMQYLMDLSVVIEQKLKGRTLLFPLSYRKWEERVESDLTENMTHTIVIRYANDNWLVKGDQENSSIHYLVVGDEDLDSKIRFEVTADVCYQQIIKIWQQTSLAK